MNRTMRTTDGPSQPAIRTWLQSLADDIAARKRDHLWRRLPEVSSAQGPRILIDSSEYLQFCTNNYLGLAADPRVIDAARHAMERYGFGAGASRLVAGSMETHQALEAALAEFKQAQAAVLFPSGYMANMAVLTTFAGKVDRIISDKLNHASLLDAAKFSQAEHRVFPHLNYHRAARLLTRPAGTRQTANQANAEVAARPRQFVVTDTVFSMDGDTADLPQLCAAAAEADALVVIDEAHATGVLGPHGRGLAELQGAEPDIAVTVGTLSKALGSMGGFVTGPAEVIEALVQRARSLIFTTAMPAACSAAAIAALDIVRGEPQRRRRLLAVSQQVRKSLEEMGFHCGRSTTPIIPVLLGEAATAVAAAEWLKSKGIFIPAIRPPTVGPGTSRLRISLMATHSDGDINQLLERMAELRHQSFYMDAAYS